MAQRNTIHQALTNRQHLLGGLIICWFWSFIVVDNKKNIKYLQNDPYVVSVLVRSHFPECELKNKSMLHIQHGSRRQRNPQKMIPFMFKLKHTELQYSFPKRTLSNKRPRHPSTDCTVCTVCGWRPVHEFDLHMFCHLHAMLQTLDNPLQQQKCLLSLEGFQTQSCRV